MRAYRAAHREETNAAAKRSRFKKHEQYKASDRAYYQKHREECIAKARERYLKRGKEQVRQRTLKFRETEEFKRAQAEREQARAAAKAAAKEKSPAYRKAHHEANREHDNAINRAWYATNREKRNRQIKEYAAAHPEETRARNRAWHERNQRRLYLRARAWREANIEKVRMYMRKRYALLKGAEGEYTLADVEKMYEAQNGQCFYCQVQLFKRFEIDHYIPLKHGGTNYPDNLRLACRRCNRSKKDTMPEVFIAIIKERIARLARLTR